MTAELAITKGKDSLVHILLRLTLFGYPSLVVLQKDVHMAFLVLWASLGLFYLRSSWQPLSDESKLVVKAVFLFLFLSALSLFNVEDWRHCLWLMSRYEPFLFMPLLLALFYRFEGILEPFFYGLILAGLVCFAVAGYEVWYMGMERAGAAFKNANRFGSVAVCIASFLTAACFLLQLSRYVRLLVAVSAFFCLWAALLSGSRGAIFVFPVLMGVLLYSVILVQRRIHKAQTPGPFRTNRYSWLFVVILLAFAVSFVGYNGFLRQHSQRAVKEFQEYLHGKRDNEASIGQRLMMWGYAIKIWRQHPWIGTGIGDVERDMTALNEADGRPMTHVYYHVHNLYLDVLASTGIAGLAGMLLACFAAPFRAFRRSFLNPASNENARYAAVCGLMALLFFALNGLSEGWIYTRGVTIFVFLLAVFLSAARVEPESRPYSPSRLP
jgi:O-antigen ligase